MTDVFPAEVRSRIMQRVRGKDTKPELAVRRFLHAMGFRFRLHRKDLPGRPDIVLPRYKTVVLVHGCFWHQHQDCRRSRMPTSNAEYWHAKLGANVERDKRNRKALSELGWHVHVVWECQIDEEHMERLVSDIRKSHG